MEEKEIHPHKKISKSGESLVRRIRSNPWIISTVVLCIFVLVMLVSGYSSNGKVLASDKAGQNLVNYLNTQTGGGVAFVSADDYKDTQFYEIIVSYNGQNIPVYVTKDGKYYLQGLSEILTSGNEIQSEGVPKSDKPLLEVFLSPYCPYGLQYEKGLIQAYNLLKDYADIKINLMSPTHIPEEKPEILSELCIQEEYGNDILFSYLEDIVYDADASECYNVYHGINLQTGESISSKNSKNGTWFVECMAPVINKALSNNGIDKNVLSSCVNNKGDSLFDDAVSYTSSLGVSGSPTPFINGYKLSGELAGRSPNAIKNAICSSFKDGSLPGVCSTSLSDSSYSPGIGEAEASGSVSSGAC